MTCHDAEPLLNAYLDGELELVRSLELEAHAGQCSGCRAALEAERQLSAAVARAPYYRATPSLRARLDHSPTTGWRRAPAWLALAAAIVLAVLVIGRADPTSNQVVQAHLRSLRAGHLVDVAAAGRRTVRPWFAGRLDYALDVEDISGRGFQLTGGRLDSLNGRTVAVLVYQRDSHVVSVFVWPAGQSSDRNPTGRMLHGFNLVDWRAEGLNWWAISDLNLEELEELPLCPCFMPVHETLRG